MMKNTIIIAILAVSLLWSCSSLKKIHNSFDEREYYIDQVPPNNFAADSTKEKNQFQRIYRLQKDWFSYSCLGSVENTRCRQITLSLEQDNISIEFVYSREGGPQDDSKDAFQKITETLSGVDYDEKKQKYSITTADGNVFNLQLHADHSVSVEPGKDFSGWLSQYQEKKTFRQSVAALLVPLKGRFGVGEVFALLNTEVKVFAGYTDLFDDKSKEVIRLAKNTKIKILRQKSRSKIIDFRQNPAYSKVEYFYEIEFQNKQKGWVVADAITPLKTIRLPSNQKMYQRDELVAGTLQTIAAGDYFIDALSLQPVWVGQSLRYFYRLLDKNFVGLGWVLDSDDLLLDVEDFSP